MAKEWQKRYLPDAWSACREAVFVYVVLPLLCVAVVWVVGMVVYQVILDPHVASLASTDCLSINPEKWFPRS